MSVTRLPTRIQGCEGCAVLLRNARAARGDAANRQRILGRHTSDGLTARYTEEYREYSATAERESTTYLAHHAEAHPIPPGQVTLRGTDNDRAPSHRKPALPPAADLAARLRDGESAEAVAAEYERTAKVISRRISLAGFNGVTGEIRTKRRAGSDGIPVLLFDSRPWIDDALCAQTDPEAFFPEKGGSTRAAKALCLTCPARLPCLEDALATDERFGVRRGLSERERRVLKKKAAS